MMKVGLLTFPVSDRLPIPGDPGTVTLCGRNAMPKLLGIGITVAGQLPIYTEFPVRLLRTPTSVM